MRGVYGIGQGPNEGWRLDKTSNSKPVLLSETSPCSFCT